MGFFYGCFAAVTTFHLFMQSNIFEASLFKQIYCLNVHHNYIEWSYSMLLNNLYSPNT